MLMKKLFTKAFNKGLRNPGRNGEAQGLVKSQNFPRPKRAGREWLQEPGKSREGVGGRGVQ